MNELMEQRTFVFNEANIAYYTAGNPNGTAIVFLHAAFCDSQLFCEQVDYFSKEYYLICIDLIGHGNSQQQKPQVNMGHMPEIIKQVLDTENVTQAHIVGVSLGSIIAQGFAHFYPESVLSVTVVGGYSVHKANKAVLKAQKKNIGKWLIKMIFSMNALKQMVCEESSYSDLCKEVFMKGSENFTRKSFMAMNGSEKLFVSSDDAVPYPLLLIVGAHDLDLAKEVAQTLHSLEPQSQLHIVNDAGHCTNIDNPTVFNQLLYDFMHSA